MDQYGRDPLMVEIYGTNSIEDMFDLGMMAEFRRIGVPHGIGDQYGTYRASSYRRALQTVEDRSEVEEYYNEAGRWKGEAAARAVVADSITRLKQLAGV